MHCFDFAVRLARSRLHLLVRHLPRDVGRRLFFGDFTGIGVASGAGCVATVMLRFTTESYDQFFKQLFTSYLMGGILAENPLFVHPCTHFGRVQ